MRLGHHPRVAPSTWPRRMSKKRGEHSEEGQVLEKEARGSFREIVGLLWGLEVGQA